MLQPDCEPIKQTLEALTQEILEIDFRIDALGALAMELGPLQYLDSQRSVDRLIKLKHTLQDKWNNTMSELAICRSSPHS